LSKKQTKLDAAEKEIELNNIEIRKLHQKLGMVERLNGKLYMDLDRSVSIFNQSQLLNNSNKSFLINEKSNT